MSYLLGKNILATVTYYDVLDMPLTAFEIWKHLMAHTLEVSHHGLQCTLGAVYAFLAMRRPESKIEEKNGFYFLHGRQHLVMNRIRSEKVSVAKLKRMRRLARILAYIPYLRMLGATGSLAMKNSTCESDWDMFVVLRVGKIWTGRTVLTGFLHLIGKRRHGHKIQDRACLNYFVTDDNLEVGTKDLFSAHEYRFFIPLINFNVFRAFELQNRWIRNFRPNFIPTTLTSMWTVKEYPWARIFQKGCERVMDMDSLERWLASWQSEKIRRNPKTAQTGSLIEVSDKALIFLPSPRGPRVFEKFKERMSF